jgi:DNA invertase Pin-like site-specific DNA recombinase
MNQLLLQLLGAVAQFERNLIRERQAEGIKVAKANGVKFGAKPKLSPSQVLEIKSAIDSGVKITEVARRFKVARPTIYKLLADVAKTKCHD